MYRAKRKDNGELIYGYLCYSPETERLGIQEMDISAISKVFRWYEIDPDTIAMETGRTDKNGAMIYGSVEVDGVMRKGGDVLEDHPSSWSVFYNYKHARFQCKRYSETVGDWLTANLFDAAGLKVIGNQFDNIKIEE